MTIEQSVPSVDALHVVNKKHTEELKRKDDQIEAIKVEIQNLRDRNDNQMKQLKEWSVDTDYLEQDELKDDFTALINKLKEVFKTVKDDVLLVAEAEYGDNNSNMNDKLVDEFVDMYKELIEKLSNYEFLYKWSVSGTVDFSISEIEAKSAEDAETQARDMCYEGFYNGDCEVDDVDASNVEQQ
jgi:predicted RNase H-like nuclease (RuvC/YqgF family)